MINNASDCNKVEKYNQIIDKDKAVDLVKEYIKREVVNDLVFNKIISNIDKYICFCAKKGETGCIYLIKDNDCKNMFIEHLCFIFRKKGFMVDYDYNTACHVTIKISWKENWT